VLSFAEAVDIDAISPDLTPSDTTNGDSKTTVPSESTFAESGNPNLPPLRHSSFQSGAAGLGYQRFRHHASKALASGTLFKKRSRFKLLYTKLSPLLLTAGPLCYSSCELVFSLSSSRAFIRTSILLHWPHQCPPPLIMSARTARY
jgi:hypothetical protein